MRAGCFKCPIRPTPKWFPGPNRFQPRGVSSNFATVRVGEKGSSVYFPGGAEGPPQYKISLRRVRCAQHRHRSNHIHYDLHSVAICRHAVPENRDAPFPLAIGSDSGLSSLGDSGDCFPNLFEELEL